ncbi:MAG TPA: ferrochelatase [Bryobacteraceae bacterium]|nr:ferrochelatase [Bryobacteraceae bacterium]
MKQAVLLVAHGAPERIEDVDNYLALVRAGRPVSAEVLAEVKRRYAEIGGSSPLLQWTRRQAEALEAQLGLPVFVGMRNWHPFLTEAMEYIGKAGIGRIAAICMAPQYSEFSVGLYMRRTEEARQKAGVNVEIVWARSFHDEPLLIEAFAERLQPVLGAGRPQVVFTAHSIPEKALASGDPYDRETRATAAAVAARAQLSGWDFAYQSQGLTNDRWLGPTVESCLDRYAAQGIQQVVIDPIGFVCDHVEILYDIDILFRRHAEGLGITLRRPESLNDSPRFTDALAEVARRCLA